MGKRRLMAFCMPFLALLGAGCLSISLGNTVRPAETKSEAAKPAAQNMPGAAQTWEAPAVPLQSGESADVFEVKLPYRQFVIHPELPGKYALVVLLHGAGERGDDNRSQLVHGVKELTAYARKNNRKCVVLAPQCPKDCSWSERGTAPSAYGAAVLALIDKKIKEFDVDTRRIYITGLSMGGYGTWALAAARPSFFAAAIPICGGGDPAAAADLSTTPLMVFHGAKDDVVAVENSRRMVDVVKAAGGNVTYVEYPEVKHFSWQPAYADPATFDWMFANQRPE